ncbi:MAG: hypothetical protein ACFFDN_00775 [Candidatus Hodarchaeota archaeon]
MVTHPLKIELSDYREIKEAKKKHIQRIFEANPQLNLKQIINRIEILLTPLNEDTLLIKFAPKEFKEFYYPFYPTINFYCFRGCCIPPTILDENNNKLQSAPLDLAVSVTSEKPILAKYFLLTLSDIIDTVIDKNMRLWAFYPFSLKGRCITDIFMINENGNDIIILDTISISDSLMEMI